jgi:hypothetical protein
MTMTDPISAAARTTAQRLAAEHGPHLAADVEAALHSQKTTPRPGQYVDPISLGSLIVAIATLAWTIYSDQRKKTPNPSHDSVTREVRVELRKQDGPNQPEADRITEIVVTQIILAAQEPR